MMPASRLVVDDARHAELFARHFVDHVTHRRAELDDRRRRAGVHQRFDPHQFLSELAAGMQVGEVLFAEALLDEQRHRQRVTERQRRRRARRRNEVQRACLLGHAAVERQVSGLRER